MRANSFDRMRLRAQVGFVNTESTDMLSPDVFLPLDFMAFATPAELFYRFFSL